MRAEGRDKSDEQKVWEHLDAAQRLYQQYLTINAVALAAGPQFTTSDRVFVSSNPAPLTLSMYC